MPKRTKRTTSVDLSVDPPSESTRPDYPEPSWGGQTCRATVAPPHDHRPLHVRRPDLAPASLPAQDRLVGRTAGGVLQCCLSVATDGDVLIWERHVDGRRVHVVLDGQQRLTALRSPVVRSDGTENEPTAARFDLASGRFGAGPSLEPDSNRPARFNFSHHIDTERQLEASADPDAIYWHHRIYAYSILSSAQVCHYLLPLIRRSRMSSQRFGPSIARRCLFFLGPEVERLVNDAADWSKVAGPWFVSLQKTTSAVMPASP